MDVRKFDKKIRCDPDIEGGISLMAKYLPTKEKQTTDCFTILYHNIQGLLQHEEDLKHSEDLKNADFVCLTETWFDSKSKFTEIGGFQSSHVTRCSAFDNSCPLFKEFSEMQHGGVSVYYRLGVGYDEIKQISKNLECIVFRITSSDTLVTVIYRPQKYLIEQFIETFSSLLNVLETMSDRMIIIGDFNQDIMKSQTTVFNYMTSRGFKQYVQDPTTENGTVIDHVYARGCPHVDVSVIPTYYSYHEAIVVHLSSKS